MYFSPTIFIAKLLAAMQVLMTLDMPLSTTMALPVTSKPIESTVENMAWQAWIELPPEQKQQVKSRKVTPKSIFTLPLRVDCPEGHKQVDTKCIPIAIGSNDVLIDLNALGLLVGNTQPEDLYDYDDVDEAMHNPLTFGSEMSVGESDNSEDGLTVELKPPSKDEPLKFNIFQNKFHIFHEEPLEDYSSILNEALQSSEKEQNFTVTTPQPSNGSSNEYIAAINNLVSVVSNVSSNSFEFYTQQAKNSTSSDSDAEESKTFTTLVDDADFKIDAISVPAVALEATNQNNLAPARNYSFIQLVTTTMDTEATATIGDRDKQPENDIQTLLQTESFLPLLNHTTATTLQNSVVDESLSLTTVPLREPFESSADSLSFNVDEELTTVANVMEPDLEIKNKQEYTRSVTTNPVIFKDSYSGDGDGDDYGADNGDNDQVKDSTLEIVTNDEPLETTTPIQLDETTIIETHSSAQQELQELLLQQEQPQKHFEELQRMRKGQKDQHVVLKKSKVQPVDLLSTTTAPATTTTTAATATADLPTATQKVDESITTTAETVTPLLTVHNENDNKDRFYYRHFAKQNNKLTESKQATAATESSSPIAATEITATNSTEIKTIPSTSEIDLAEELRLIKELVKGVRPATTLTIMKTMPTTTTTTTTTLKPLTSTTEIFISEDIQSSSSSNLPSESSLLAKKSTLSASQIWSKILPLLTTTSTTPMPNNITIEDFKESNPNELNNNQAIRSTSSSSLRSNRNSKIIRIDGFATAKAREPITTAATTTTTTPTITTIVEDSTLSSPATSSTTENNTYEPYWWLPLAWRKDKPTSTEKQTEEQEVKSHEQPLLLRFWSAYAPKLS